LDVVKNGLLRIKVLGEEGLEAHAFGLAVVIKLGVGNPIHKGLHREEDLEDHQELELVTGLKVLDH